MFFNTISVLRFQQQDVYSNILQWFQLRIFIRLKLALYNFEFSNSLPINSLDLGLKKARVRFPSMKNAFDSVHQWNLRRLS